MRSLKYSYMSYPNYPIPRTFEYSLSNLDGAPRIVNIFQKDILTSPPKHLYTYFPEN